MTGDACSYVVMLRPLYEDKVGAMRSCGEEEYGSGDYVMKAACVHVARQVSVQQRNAASTTMQRTLVAKLHSSRLLKEETTTTASAQHTNEA